MFINQEIPNTCILNMKSLHIFNIKVIFYKLRLLLRRGSLNPLFVAVPLSAPDSVQILVHNSTLAEVRWEPVPLPSVQGKLQGYKVQFHRNVTCMLESLLSLQLLVTLLGVLPPRARPSRNRTGAEAAGAGPDIQWEP